MQNSYQDVPKSPVCLNLRLIAKAGQSDRPFVLLMSFVSAFQATTLIGIKTLCCEKTTLQSHLHFAFGYNGFMKK